VRDPLELAVLHEPVTELGQAAAALAAAGHDLAATPLGAGDRLLLRLHHELAGRDPEVTVTCPTCGAVSMATLAPAALPPHAPRCAWLGPGGGLREPTYRDLDGLPDDPAAALAALLERCTVGAPPRAPVSGDLDHADDSLAGPLLLACSGCDALVECQADVQRLALAGLVAAADGADAEVHLLAFAYHWPLPVIEALPPRRRSRLARRIEEGR
jgi:hypothetical protein